jgi:hypothetical protein
VIENTRFILPSAIFEEASLSDILLVSEVTGSNSWQHGFVLPSSKFEEAQLLLNLFPVGYSTFYY